MQHGYSFSRSGKGHFAAPLNGVPIVALSVLPAGYTLGALWYDASQPLKLEH